MVWEACLCLKLSSEQLTQPRADSRMIESWLFKHGALGAADGFCGVCLAPLHPQLCHSSPNSDESDTHVTEQGLSVKQGFLFGSQWVGYTEAKSGSATRTLSLLLLRRAGGRVLALLL